MTKVNIIVITVIIFIIIILPTSVSAQTPDPATWQTGATGLKLQTILIRQANGTNVPEKKTAGLGFNLEEKGWPYLGLPGGAQNGTYGQLNSPVGVDLGLIKIPPASSSVLSSEAADWSSNLLTFNAGLPEQIKIWVSRLTPSLLTQIQSTTLRLLAGNVDKYTLSGGAVTNQPPVPSYPKWAAYSSGGTIQIRQLSTTALSLPSLDSNWILIWYGANSHFVETKKPQPYPFPLIKNSSRFELQALPHSEAYQADVPILLKFQNAPSSIVHSSEGGIDLTFGSSAGYTSALPVLGRDYPLSTDTEGWGASSSLPQSLISKINFWIPRLCDFPSQVSESYAYDGLSDVSTITENITFINTGCTGTQFAPIPPFLALAKDTLGGSLTFSGALVDGSLPSEFGPTFGIDGVSSYSWNLSGLKKYTDGRRVIINIASASAELVSELTAQADKIVTDGHYAPWLFNNRYHNVTIGEVYWHNIADVIIALSEIMPALPEPQKTNLINYLKSERSSYPPETSFKLALNQGKTRDYFSASPNEIVSGNTVASNWEMSRRDIFYKRVPLYNFYSLFRYYDLTGEAIPASVMSAAITTLDLDMKEQDWATMYWFRTFPDPDKIVAVVNSQRYFAGLLGVINLARNTGDIATENLARSLLAKAVVSRVAMAKYPGYLYSTGLNILPVSPSWNISYTAGAWYANLFNFNWSLASDDARQVAYLDQFRVTAHDNSGFGQTFRNNVQAIYSPTLLYKDLVPELGRVLFDFAKSETETHLQKAVALMPNWNLSFSDAVFGGEHDLNHPIDSFQIFMAKSWISGESGQNLERYIDIPWLSGDLFYLQKLAEAIKVQQGITWSTQGGAPQPTPTPGAPSPTPTSTPTPTSGLSPTPTPTPAPTSTPTPTPTTGPTATPTPGGPDTTPPTVTITNPANGALVSGTVTITASASDSGSGVSRVIFHVNGVHKCTDYTSPYSCNWVVPAGSGINYTIKVYAYDNANNLKSAFITVTSQ